MSALSGFSLEGKRVLITGANTGIGQGIAVSAARAGSYVVGVGRSSMSETAEMIAAIGGKFHAYICDLCDPVVVKGLMADVVIRIGPLYGLVNNAGIIRRGDALDLSEQDWDDVLDLNLKVAFLLSQAFGRQLIGEGRPGRVVNIASMLSFQGGIRVASYTAVKHGILGLTRVVANEWAPHNINVNAIAPGYIVSNNTRGLRGGPRSKRPSWRASLRTDGQARRHRRCCRLLLAQPSNYMHGAVIPVDGGWLSR